MPSDSIKGMYRLGRRAYIMAATFGVGALVCIVVGFFWDPTFYFPTAVFAFWAGALCFQAAGIRATARRWESEDDVLRLRWRGGVTWTG